MKKLLVFLLCMLMAVSVFGALSVSAEEASIPAETIAGLVEFNGYSVRTNDYNGIRAEFDLNKAKLAELEATYDVKIDMLFAKAGAEAPDSLANYEGLQLGNAGAKSTFYDSKNGGYLGKIYSEEEGKAKFFYTVTFKNASETKDNLNADLYFRLVVTLTDKSDETVTATIPVDCKSPSFKYAVSLSEVASKLVSSNVYDNVFVRRAISIANGNYTNDAEKATLLGKELSAYSIVVDAQTIKNANNVEASYTESIDLTAARALAAALEKKVGISLPIRYNTPDNEEAYIKIDTSATFANKYAYEVTAEGSVITVKANTIPAVAEGGEALAAAIAKGDYAGEKLKGTIYSFDYDSLYVRDEDLIYQVDFFDSKASFGPLVGGSFGNSSYYRASTAEGYTDHYVAGNANVTASSTYFDDYVIGTPAARAYGALMQLPSPWYYSYKSGSTVYGPNSSYDTQYYTGYGDNMYFPSVWRDGYLELGYATTFNMQPLTAIFRAKLSEDGTKIENGEYTLQIVASLNDSHYYDENGVYLTKAHAYSQQSFMLGATRIHPAPYSSASNIAFGSSVAFRTQSSTTAPKSYAPNLSVKRAGTSVNEFLVSVSGYYYKDEFTSNASITALGSGNYLNTTIALGVNASDYFVNKAATDISNYNSTQLEDASGNQFPFITLDNNFNIGSGMNTQVYAVRIYKDILTGDEVIQNHFADVAKFFKLDLTDFELVTNTDDRKSIFALASDVTLDSSEEVVAVLQDKVTAAIEKALMSGFVVTYGDADDFVLAAQDGSFELPVPAIEYSDLLKGKYNRFVGYDLGDELVTDASGKKLSSYILESDITVEPKYEVVDYSALYVQDNLIYHISFLHARESDTLDTLGSYVYDTFKDTHTTDFDKYEIYAAHENFRTFSKNATVDTVTGKNVTVNKVEYPTYTAAPQFKDGYLQLGRKLYNADESLKAYVYTPIGFWLGDSARDYGGKTYYHDTDYSVQFVAAAEGDTYVTQAYLGCFRGYTEPKKIGEVTYVSAGGFYVSRYGYASDNFKKTVFKTYFKTANEDSSVTYDQTTFVKSDAITYTYAFDIDNAKTQYVYDPEHYMEGTKDGNYVAFSAPKADSVYAKSSESNYYIPGFADRADYVADQKRADVTAFKGVELEYTGLFTSKSYFGNKLVGEVNEHTTLGKNFYAKNTLFSLGDANQTNLRDGFNVYALRCYTDILEKADIEQNNFADIAYKFLLDIDDFNTASPEVKTAVYAAFAEKTVNTITAEDAQALLDATLAK